MGATVVLAAVGPGGLATASPTRTIAVADFRFAPAAATAVHGTRVLFIWRGRAPHDVRGAGPAPFASRIQRTGAFAVTITRKGVYRITCTVHPRMRLVLRVT
ncbi:MAG: hypothetical protein QOK40_1839 [Miltoncostaeaceae bacterium]|nr:hypothetical protein [Miltoncostaeaceae bacterium]